MSKIDKGLLNMVSQQNTGNQMTQIVNISKDIISTAVDVGIPIVTGFAREISEHIKKEMVSYAKYKNSNMPYEEIVKCIKDNWDDPDIKMMAAVFKDTDIHKDDAEKLIIDGIRIKKSTSEEVRKLRPDIGACCNIGGVKMGGLITLYVPANIDITGAKLI